MTQPESLLGKLFRIFRVRHFPFWEKYLAVCPQPSLGSDYMSLSLPGWTQRLDSSVKYMLNPVLPVALVSTLVHSLFLSPLSRTGPGCEA